MWPRLSAGGLMFEPLEKRQSLGADIAQHLQELLLNGTFKPGDYLPSQRELASRYGTSLAAVREAISILSAAGLIDARPGRGTVVLELRQQTPGFSVWLGAIHSREDAVAFFETRETLERYTLERAALRVTPEEIGAMHTLLLEMRQARGDPERYVQADLALHFAIADAAGNPVVARLLRVIHTPLAGLLRSMCSTFFEPERFERILQTHRDMVDALERRDAPAALLSFSRMMGEALEGDALSRALGGGVPVEAPLGVAFLEDLRWNLTRLIGPMSEVLLSDAAGERGVALEGITRGQLRGFLGALEGQLPAPKLEEWRALSELLLRRYEN